MRRLELNRATIVSFLVVTPWIPAALGVPALGAAVDLLGYGFPRPAERLWAVVNNMLPGPGGPG